jgi:hypothetical protein
MSLELKKLVHAECRAVLERHIKEIRETMESFQEAANNEIKSTAGDKHETTRAMMQDDRDKTAALLANTVKMQPLLERINPDRKMETVGVGALVETDLGYLFVSVPLGSVDLEGKHIMVISPVSPVGHAMLEKGIGDSFVVNDKKHTILSIS